MQMQTGNIKVTKTARYYFYGNVQESHNEIVLVLHGYGMQASAFLENFSILQKEGRLIVAPEGLSRFYKRGFSGDVVASWMTKEDRLLEIEDYIGYLDNLADELHSSNARLIVIGFSQGATSASRWLLHGKTVISDFVIWCGEFAREPKTTSNPLPPIYHVRASNDEFIAAERFDEQLNYLTEAGFEVKEHLFEGKHIVDQQTLAQLMKEITS